MQFLIPCFHSVSLSFDVMNHDLRHAWFTNVSFGRSIKISNVKLPFLCEINSCCFAD